MKRILCTAFAALTLWLCLTRPGAASSDAREVDALHSTMTVHVYKSGFLSAFAHNHEIQAPIQSGQVKESGSPSVEIRIDTRKLRVLDPEASDSTRAQIQETMLGNQVLDADHFPQRFIFNLPAWNRKGQTIGSCMGTWDCTARITQLRSRGLRKMTAIEDRRC
jgi:hypothetical protein